MGLVGGFHSHDRAPPPPPPAALNPRPPPPPPLSLASSAAREEVEGERGVLEGGEAEAGE